MVALRGRFVEWYYWPWLAKWRGIYSGAEGGALACFVYQYIVYGLMRLLRTEFPLAGK